MAKNFKKKRLFTVAALTVLLALAMLVFAACETGKTYTLTFETGNGSAVSPIKAKAGDKIDMKYINAEFSIVTLRRVYYTYCGLHLSSKPV